MAADPIGSAPLPADHVKFTVDYEEERSRLTTFFRLFTALPHVIWLCIYAIGAFFAVVFAWFALVITARYPEGLYSFVENYNRYQARVYAYAYLATDKFPPFSGAVDQPYNAHWSLGPPLEKYSRWKAFFRGILAIPFAIVAYVFQVIYQLAAFISWFAIVFTGKQPKGLQDAIIFGLSYVERLNTYYSLQTEAWPTQFTDEQVDEELGEAGVSVGAISSTPEAPVPPEPPTPPAPPEPPAPPAPPAP